MTKVLSATHARRRDTARPTGSETTCGTPYLDAVRGFAGDEPTRLTAPGHKGGLAAPVALLRDIGTDAAALDVPQLLTGVDRETGRLSPFGVAERRAAIAWGAARTWFLTGGATQGNLAACLAVAMEGRRVAVQRSSHASTFNGIALAGLDPIAVMPELDGALGIAHGVEPEALDAELRAAPETHAVFVVSPTYFGACADVAGLAEVAHRHGAALIVDETWGAHLHFSGAVPDDALTSGADLVVSGTHKHLGSLNGSAMLHLSTAAPDWLSADRIRRALAVVGSTSPSSLLLASLDAARARAEAEGDPLLAMAARELGELRETIRSIPGLDVVDERHVGRPGFAALDPLRLTIDVRGTGRTGYELASALRANAGIELQVAQERVVVAVFGLGESPLLTGGALVDALSRMSAGWVRVARSDRSARMAKRAAAAAVRAAHVDGAAASDRGDLPGAAVRERVAVPGGAGPAAPREARRPARFGCTPREALLASGVMVPLEAADGRIAAEAIVPYPPGIPAVLPGEVIDVRRLLALRDALHLGAHLRGASDPLLGAIRVIEHEGGTA